MGDVVTSERHGATAVLRIDRPETLNALDTPTLLALEAAFGEAEAEEAVRAVILTGAGDRAFVAGGDIAELRTRDGLRHYLEIAEILHRVFRRIEVSDKPTIAAVNGWALGGGCELLLTTDIRILSDRARIGLPEMKIGLFPGAGGTQRLLRQVPLCRAKEMMMLGEPIGAEEAVALGLANRVVPHERLMEEALATAETLGRRSPLVLKLLKRSLLHGGDMPLGAALPFEQAMIGLVFDTADAKEGCEAFLEKRPPVFEGR